MSTAAESRAAARGGVSFGREAWRQVWASRVARACLAVLAIFFLAALWGEAANAWYAWRDVTPPWQAQNLAARHLPPCAAHWLGTDGLGRDVGLRLAQGARHLEQGGAVTCGEGVHGGVDEGEIGDPQQREGQIIGQPLLPGTGDELVEDGQGVTRRSAAGGWRARRRAP